MSSGNFAPEPLLQGHCAPSTLSTSVVLGALVVSSYLPEVVDLADRVLVMRSGTIVAELHRGEASEDRILAAATGSRPSSPGS